MVETLFWSMPYISSQQKAVLYYTTSLSCFLVGPW
jgi:hypothetical protein